MFLPYVVIWAIVVTLVILSLKKYISYSFKKEEQKPEEKQVDPYSVFVRIK